MVNQNNDNIELAMAKERYPAPSAPLTEKHANGTAYEKSESKRPPSRKRCCITMVVVMVAIGAGTILLYEYLLGWQPEVSEESSQPEVARSSFKLPGVGNRSPKMNDPMPSSTTELVSINSTTELIFIDTKTSNKPQVNRSTEKVPRKKEQQEPVDNYSGSGDDDTERSGDGMQGDEARGSGDGIK